MVPDQGMTRVFTSCTIPPVPTPRSSTSVSPFSVAPRTDQSKLRATASVRDPRALRRWQTQACRPPANLFFVIYQPPSFPRILCPAYDRANVSRSPVRGIFNPFYSYPLDSLQSMHAQNVLYCTLKGKRRAVFSLAKEEPYRVG